MYVIMQAAKPITQPCKGASCDSTQLPFMHITSHSQGDSAKKVDHHTTHTYVALKGKSTNGKIEEDHMGLHLDGIFRLHTLGVAAIYKRG